MQKKIIKLGYIIILIVFITIFLLLKVSENSYQFEKYYNKLFYISVIGIVLLFIFIFYFLYKLIRNNYKQIPGSSLSVNILSKTLLLAFIPILFISFFSFRFLNYDFKLSFDNRVNKALNNSLELSKKTLNNRITVAINKSLNISRQLAPLDYIDLPYEIQRIRKNNNIYELTIFDEKGFVQSYSSEDLTTIFPTIPIHSNFAEASRNQSSFNLKKIESGFEIIILTKINKIYSPNYYLKSTYKVPSNISELVNQITKTIEERDNLNFFKPKINDSFTLVLILVLLLSLALIVLSSISLANYMGKPIKKLVFALDAVSEGSFKEPLDLKRDDDFGHLINSFNEMNLSLKKATKEATYSKQRVENERSYLETIIENMTSAVITLDYKKRLLTFNTYAEKLLNSNLKELLFTDIQSINLEKEQYIDFINQLEVNNLKNNYFEKEVKIKVSKTNLEKQFVVRLTKLPENNNRSGFVVIFDDLTKYWEKQKSAAWEEVSKRLAHEIKNPLTPIQLSAERMEIKLKKYLPEKEKEILNKTVSVIINQVQAMKNMVNDFSNFSKMKNKDDNINLNLHSLINNVFKLYQGHYENIIFTNKLVANNFLIKGDKNSLRQVLHNLIKNAIESIKSNNENKNGLIEIKTFNLENKIILEIIDNGEGFDYKKSIFDPYVSSKPKGTGLGLSIVKKIIKDHNAKIEINNNSNKKGVIVRIEFLHNQT